MPDLPKSALWYAKHGWQIFPLRPRTKEPFYGIGVYNATSDTDQVMDWWRKWPQANIGLHCGGSGLLALDLDTYKECFAGSSIFIDGDYETLSSRTGSGGTHLIYRTPEGVKYGNQTGDLPQGIDVRGYGGYIVLPPSVHPNGKRYEWEFAYSPADTLPSPLPLGLKSILDAARSQQRVCGEPSSSMVATAIKGVETLIEKLGLSVSAPTDYDNGGRRWNLNSCPFQPMDNPHKEDRRAYILIARDGHPAAGCSHARCQERLKSLHLNGWTYLWHMVYGRVAA